MQISIGIGIGNGAGNVKGGGSTAVFSDDFTRADSALTMGAPWTAVQGTWGVRSGKGYSVTDTDKDLAWAASAGSTTFTYQADITGSYVTNFRYPSLIAHYVDANNYFYFRLDGNSAEIVKYEAGSSTIVNAGAQTSTNGTTYTLKVVAVDGVLTLFVNGTQRATYTLTSPQRTTYLGSTKVGVRLSKSGSPAINADIDNITLTTP